MSDREETERLYRQQVGRMQQLASILLGEEEEARDAVSDVFARLVDGTLHLPKEKPESYLLVSLRNLCLDRIRHLSVKERMKRQLTMSTPSLTPVETEQELAAEIITYAEQTMTAQTWRVFQLRFDEGLSVSETSKQLGISEGAVYKHLAKALRQLREHFNPKRR
ncbi:MAG: sigma-70 family RNA polymerase sigma factor [Prevotella sp.]|nr:sigma-70 family RNA polymerase sigma factor [Prevotella sp.]